MKEDNKPMETGKERQRQKTEWRFEYKNVICEIVFWTEDRMKEDLDLYWAGGIWNSYIYIKKEKLPELFDKVNLRLRTRINPFDKGKSSPRKDTGFDYMFELDFQLVGGNTFYEKLYDVKGKVYCIKIGNDYNHIWNNGESKDSIKHDLIKAIDELLTPTNND